MGSSLAALNAGSIDVLAGGKVEMKFDFGSPPSVPGFYYSSPYYFGNETAGTGVSSFSLTTREDDKMFSSFVNCIVLATIYAQENGIKRERSNELPLVSTFGR